MISLARFNSASNGRMYPDRYGDWNFAPDVESLLAKMEQRHKLAMDKLRALLFNTKGTFSGRMVSGPGTISRMTEEQIVAQGRSCRGFAASTAKMIRCSRSMKRIMDKLAGDTIQFEVLEL